MSQFSYSVIYHYNSRKIEKTNIFSKKLRNLEISNSKQKSLSHLITTLSLEIHDFNEKSNSKDGVLNWVIDSPLMKSIESVSTNCNNTNNNSIAITQTLPQKKKLNSKKYQ
jgi:hypothetical protein